MYKSLTDYVNNRLNSLDYLVCYSQRAMFFVSQTSQRRNLLLVCSYLLQLDLG